MGIRPSKSSEVIGQRLISRIPEIPQELKEYKFPFENLALEGGGCKTYAYLGALKVLEEIGVLQNMRRFAGASGGAVIGALLAVGYDVTELYEFFAVDLTKLSSDASFGYWALLPNLLNHFGWHPCRKVQDYIRQHIAKKCNGNADITFKELYRQRQVELCICVSNITKMCLEFCHPKTTPDMSISDAVRMSISLPIFYQPFKHTHDGQTSFYVDGGMLCNYPVFTFDGWYLSMDPKNAFLNKLGGGDPPFEEVNNKTIGMLVYATEDAEMLRTDLHARYDNFKVPRPNTELAISRAEECDRQLENLRKRAELATAAKHFWKALHKCDIERDGIISIAEFKQAVKSTRTEDIELLFGKKLADESDFDAMDMNKDGKISYKEFIHFMDYKGLAFKETMEGCASVRHFDSFGSFGNTLIDTMGMAIKKMQIKPHDVARTIGVHTDYVQTTDFEINDDDREYMVARAEHATISFLQEYISKKDSSTRLERRLQATD